MAPESSGFTRPGPPRSGNNPASAAATAAGLIAQADPRHLAAAGSFAAQQDPQQLASAVRFVSQQDPQHVAAAGRFMAAQDPAQLASAGRLLAQQDPQHVVAAGRFMAAQDPQHVAAASRLLGAQQDPQQLAAAASRAVSQHDPQSLPPAAGRLASSSSQSIDPRAFVAGAATTVSKPPAAAAAAPSSPTGSHPHPQVTARRQARQAARNPPHSPSASTQQRPPPAAALTMPSNDPHGRAARSSATPQTGPMVGMTVDRGCRVDPSLAVLKGLQSGFAGCLSPLDSLTDEVTLTVSHRDSRQFIWAHPAFVDLLADPHQSRGQRQQQLKPSFATMLHSVELVAAALQRTAEVRVPRAPPLALALWSRHSVSRRRSRKRKSVPQRSASNSALSPFTRS
jgi:hypothetical protein